MINSKELREISNTMCDLAPDCYTLIIQEGVFHFSHIDIMVHGVTSELVVGIVHRNNIGQSILEIDRFRNSACF